ncbi:hypothetical protein Scep_012539 [Stephania cephalantha]|uniref:Uncharacterized protein n=1 Tax=Stephania cephalantha TaxID=152367 RepID=A0AAP0JF37_9MAGN
MYTLHSFNLFPNCVVATGEVVCHVFLATDELLWMEQLAVHSSPHFINDSGLKVHEDSIGNMLPCTGFAEEGVEGIISFA